jgi:hypothetical protein
MSEFKKLLISIKGYFKKRTPTQRLMNRIHTQEILGNIFRWGFSYNGPFYRAYLPDSHYAFQAHPEFKELQQRFTAHNRRNNGGDTARLWSFILNCKQVLGENVSGDFAELGVWRGNTASILAYYAAQHNRKVFLFDTYEGFSKDDLTGIDAQKEMDFNNTSIELVKSVIGPNAAQCSFVKGFFPDTITAEHENRQYAIVSLDCDLYAPTKAGLEFFYARMPKGGLFLLHDYSSLHWDGSKKAIDEFCAITGECVILMPDKSGSAFLRKTH